MALSRSLCSERTTGIKRFSCSHIVEARQRRPSEGVIPSPTVRGLIGVANDQRPHLAFSRMSGRLADDLIDTQLLLQRFQGGK